MAFMASDLPEPEWKVKLFLNEKLSDCVIWAKNRNYCVRFPCHKTILASKSDVFAEIFVNLEKKEESIIVVEDVNPDAMMKILDYIYTGCFTLQDWKLACDILKIAKKYQISNIIKECEDFLGNEVNFHNICCIFEKVILLDSPSLEKRCEEFCRKYGFLVLQSSAFQAATVNVVKRILSTPELQIGNEMTTFSAAWKWATYMCCKNGKIISDENIADEMSPLLDCINFKFFSVKQLNSIPKAAMSKFRLILPNLGELNGNVPQDAFFRLGRKLCFPMDDTFGNIKFHFRFNFFPKTHLAGRAILMRFVVNRKVCLKEIVYDRPQSESPFSSLLAVMGSKENSSGKLMKPESSFPTESPLPNTSNDANSKSPDTIKYPIVSNETGAYNSFAFTFKMGPPQSIFDTAGSEFSNLSTPSAVSISNQTEIHNSHHVNGGFLQNIANDKIAKSSCTLKQSEISVSKETEANHFTSKLKERTFWGVSNDACSKPSEVSDSKESLLKIETKPNHFTSNIKDHSSQDIVNDSYFKPISSLTRFEVPDSKGGTLKTETSVSEEAKANHFTSNFKEDSLQDGGKDSFFKSIRLPKPLKVPDSKGSSLKTETLVSKETKANHFTSNFKEHSLQDGGNNSFFKSISSLKPFEVPDSKESPQKDFCFVGKPMSSSSLKHPVYKKNTRHIQKHVSQSQSPNPHSSLSICNRKGILVSHNCPLRNGCSSDSQPFHFKAEKFVILEPNEEYTIESDREDLFWSPCVYEQSMQCGNVKINFGQTWYGISEISFIEIP